MYTLIQQSMQSHIFVIYVHTIDLPAKESGELEEESVESKGKTGEYREKKLSESDEKPGDSKTTVC